MAFITRTCRLRCFFGALLCLLFVLPTNDAGRGLGVIVCNAVYRRLRILGSGAGFAPRLQSMLAFSHFRVVSRRFHFAVDSVRFAVGNFRRTHFSQPCLTCRVCGLAFIRLWHGIARRTGFLLVCLCVIVYGRYFIRRTLYLAYGSHTESSVQ